MALITPTSFSAAELEGAKKIRNHMKKAIPAEFDTDFYLARWWRAYDGDLKAIERKMKELFDHRKLMGYDRLEMEQLETKLDFARKTFERFSISPVAANRFSGNVNVFVQKMSGTDLKEITKVLPLSYVLNSYYILQESFTRSILQKEAETGCPAAGATILDLEGICLADFINPLSNPTKLARLVVKIWADFFKEGLLKLVLINPPALLSVMWQIARFIMDKKMQSRIVFLENSSDLLKYFHPEVSSLFKKKDAICLPLIYNKTGENRLKRHINIIMSNKQPLYAVPECYGGLWRDDSGRADPPESACRKPVRVSPQHYYDPNKICRDHGFINLPEVTSTSLKGKQTLEVAKKCERDGQSLLFHFTVNGDIEFDIVRVDDQQETAAWPKVTLTSLKAPEQGAIKCKKGDYIVRFTNPANSWIPLKLHYAVEMCPV